MDLIIKFVPHLKQYRLKVYYSFDNFVPPSFPVVTTGTFDGVHLGHIQIFNRLKTLARQHHGETIVVTFDPHPRSVIHPDLALKLLHTIDEKIDRLDKAGIDHFIIIPFTKAFSALSSMEFVRDYLIQKCQTKLLVIGYDHQFGRNREGSIVDLEEFAEAYDFQIEQIAAHTFDDINISSTKIRAALAVGDIKTANTFLGYKFMLSGTVEHGNKLGNTIGFPTANIAIKNPYKIIPASGVYAVHIEIDKVRYNGMLNIGQKPTVTDGIIKSIEVNIFDFSGNLYHQKIHVSFCARLRDEQKFANVDLLKKQLAADKLHALKVLAE